MQRIHALAVIAEYADVRGDRINWPIAIRTALGEAEGQLDAEQSVLEAIGILIDLPLGRLIGLEDAARDIEIEALARTMFEEGAVKGGFANAWGGTEDWEALSIQAKGNYTILATQALKVFQGGSKRG